MFVIILSSILQSKFISTINAHFKVKLHKGKRDFFSLKEILNEIGCNVDLENYQWLNEQALQSNPKILTDNSGYRYRYLPKYSFTNGSELLATLRAIHMDRGAGICFEDISESLPNAEEVLINIQHKIHILTKSKGKNRIIFYRYSLFLILIFYC